LFALVDPIELKRAEAYRLCESAAENWAHVRPEIFGTLFQDSMDKNDRHAFGAHFTSEFDIRKVVGPTIVRPWRERIEAAGKNVGELRKALVDLRKFRVLDPACGSGNFLFIAYREMKRLERDILLRLREVSKREPLESAISLHQFFGIDVIPFAVELAKVTLMLAKELELIEAQKLAETDQLLIEEKPLPLDNLDKNIVCADALFTDWPKADAIIGNPPYLGAKRLKPEHGPDYVNKLRKSYSQVPGMADYCVYWFRKTHDQLSNGGHAGLVGTQNIRNIYSRKGGLDYIVDNGGVITDAIATQVWSGEAAVHVSIVNWTKNGAVLQPRHLSIQRGDSVESPWETFELPHINSALSPGIDVSRAEPLHANTTPQRCFNGQMIGHSDFLISDTQRTEMIRRDSATVEITFPYLNGIDALTGAKLDRYVIDFEQRDRFEAEKYREAFDWVAKHVLPDRTRKAEEGKDATGKVRPHHRAFLARWWQLSFGRPEMLSVIKPLKRYLACAYVTKRPIFMFVSSQVRPSNLIQVFGFDDDYSFGILQSGLHWLWFITKCGKLKGDFRYSAEAVFDTFPWPQNPTNGQIRAIADAAVAVRTLRRTTMDKLKYSLRQFYRTLDQPGDNPLRDAHAQLDAAVRAAYGMSNESDPLAFLLDLNQNVAHRIERAEPVAAPGIPPNYPGAAEMVTEDCIKPS
jgi:SAM-dependent methyltransferase